MKIPKVSVIMPVYNVEKYLPNALDSLQNQTLHDTEFICINDGSKDNSREILENYAKNDSRFRVINQENIGTGATRNKGLFLANGEYIAFIDGDDTFEPNAMNELFNQAKKQNTDMTVFNYRNVDENGKPLLDVNMAKNVEDVFDLKKDKTFNWIDVKKKVFGGFFWSSWNKIFRNKFLKDNNIKFTDCSMSEDNAFLFDSTLRADKIGYNDEYLYNYTQRQNSAVNTVSDRNFCIFKVYKDIVNVLKKLGLSEELKEEFDDYVADTMCYHYKRVKSKDEYLKRCNEMLTPEQINKMNALMR